MSADTNGVVCPPTMISNIARVLADAVHTYGNSRITPDYAVKLAVWLDMNEPPELEQCPYCGLMLETPCDEPPPDTCSKALEHELMAQGVEQAARGLKARQTAPVPVPIVPSSEKAGSVVPHQEQPPAIRSCLGCQHAAVPAVSEPCISCSRSLGFPGWQACDSGADGEGSDND